MKTKSVFVLALCVVLGLFGSVVVAQDEGPTIESVTADPAAYYGQEVTLEGTVSELVNVRSFILDEDALLDNDQLLVINNTGQEFDLRVTAGQYVIVTGVIHPNYAEGGLSEISEVGVMDSADTVDTMEATEAVDEAMITPMAEMTEEAMVEGATEEPMADMTPTVDMNAGAADPMTNTGPMLSSMVVREDLQNYVILELTSVTNITFVEPE